MYDHLLYVVGLASDTPFELLKSKRKDAFICRPRQIVFHYMRIGQKTPLLTISQASNMDRSTIRHSVKVINDDLTNGVINTYLIYSRFLRLLAEEAKTRSYQSE